jgi:hypothetical protein
MYSRNSRPFSQLGSQPIDIHIFYVYRTAWHTGLVPGEKYGSLVDASQNEQRPCAGHDPSSPDPIR